MDIDDLLNNLFPDPEEVVRVVDDARRDTRYRVTDYPVELLVAKFREDPVEEGDIYIPPYQRQLRWPPKSRSYFIESVLLRIPIRQSFSKRSGDDWRWLMDPSEYEPWHSLFTTNFDWKS